MRIDYTKEDEEEYLEYCRKEVAHRLWCLCQVSADFVQEEFETAKIEYPFDSSLALFSQICCEITERRGEAPLLDCLLKVARKVAVTEEFSVVSSFLSSYELALERLEALKAPVNTGAESASTLTV